MFISINRAGLMEKPGPGFDWASYQEAFEPESLSVQHLLTEIAEGSSFAPVFDGRRCRENFYLAQHIGLDFDNEDGGIRGLDDLLSDPFIAAHAALIYPTLSWTPERPRFRVVFVLDEPIRSAGGYEAALHTVMRLYPTSDSQCKDISRAYFGNGTISRDHLWRHVADLDNTLAVGVLRHYYLSWKNTEAERTAHRITPPASRPKNQPADMDVVMEQLERIDPYAMSRDEWVKVGSGLAREFGDAAFERFKQWSDVPGHKGLSMSEWNSMKRDHSTPATIGSVLHVARKYGGRL